MFPVKETEAKTIFDHKRSHRAEQDIHQLALNLLIPFSAMTVTASDEYLLIEDMYEARSG